MIGYPARQAIQTRYLAPTNHRGARVKATCDAGSVTVAWDYALDTQANHGSAVQVLTTRLGWAGLAWYGGGIGNGYVWVSK